jgi:hypothetical protein
MFHGLEVNGAEIASNIGEKYKVKTGIQMLTYWILPQLLSLLKIRCRNWARLMFD